MSLTASQYPVSNEMNAESERIERILEATQKEVDRLSHVAPTANSTYRNKFNQRMVALLDEPKFKTDKLREAQAHVDCAKEYLDYKLQEALLDAARDALFTYRALLSAWQSKCSNLKTEAEVARVGAPAMQPTRPFSSGGWRP